MPKTNLQPTRAPRNVPTGTPKANARGVPIIATAIALPFNDFGAISRAYPAVIPHSTPAVTPAKKRAIIVRVKLEDRAVVVLNTRNPVIHKRSKGFLCHPCVAVVIGIAAISEPRA